MPLTNLGAGAADKLGSIPGVNIPGSIFGGTNVIRKKFINVNKNPKSSGNGVTDFDDPTYLGFTLTFNILSPLFNGATNGNANAGPSSGVENNTVEGSESAIGYLKSIGETNRANYLMAFIQGMREINNSRPYYWQAIEGMSEAWKKISAFGPDPFVGSAESDGITISCLEAVDLKLTALFTLYRLAVYDSKYRRYVVPQNLLYFDVDVKIGEIRQFKKTINYIAAMSGGKSHGNNTADVVGDNASFVTFKFKDCQWLAEESGKVFESVGNGEGTVASTSIKWSFCNVWIDGEFAGYDSALLETRNQTTEDGKFDLTNFAKETASQIGEQLATAAATAAQRAVTSAAQKLLFGSVHGGAQSQIEGILSNPGGAAVGGITNAVSGNGGGGTIGIRLNENILGEPGPINKSLPTDKVFSESQPGPQLNPTKVFNGSPSGPPLNSTNVHG